MRFARVPSRLLLRAFLVALQFHDGFAPDIGQLQELGYVEGEKGL